MRQGMDLGRLGRFVAPGVAIALAAAAGAQERGGAPGERPADDARPLLSGPPVEDAAPPGVVEGFGSGSAERMMAGEPLPPRVLHRILEGMMSEDAPAEVRLTPEQREGIEALRAAFDQERRDYMREHADELRDLRRRGDVDGPESDRRRPPRPEADGQRPPARDGERGDRPRARQRDEGDRPMEDGASMEGREREGGQRGREEARRRLREVMAAGPSTDKLYADVWEILTEPQQQHVEQQVARFHEEMAERRREGYVERQVRDMRGRREGEGAGPGAPGRGAERRPLANADQRRERLIEIFNSLSPEEQVRLIDRLERAMGERRAERAGVRDGVEKPAPGIEGVDVPPPEERPQRGGPRDDE